MLEPQTLKYLRQLKKNNNKAWFDSHRVQFEAAKIDFANFIQLVIEALGKKDPAVTGMMSKDCIFRINRDIRFSKDKTPYKSHFGAIIKKGGRKSPYAGYYFHCEPGKSFTGGGIWTPEPAELKKLRQELDYNWQNFQSLIHTSSFKKIYGDIYKGDDVSMKSIPKGYEKENPAADYLKLKSIIAETRLDDKELTTSGLHRKTVNALEVLYPLIDFINSALE